MEERGPAIGRGKALRCRRKIVVHGAHAKWGRQPGPCRAKTLPDPHPIAWTFPPNSRYPDGCSD